MTARKKSAKNNDSAPADAEVASTRPPKRRSSDWDETTEANDDTLNNASSQDTDQQERNVDEFDQQPAESEDASVVRSLSDTEFMQKLTESLREAASGIGFVYAALDSLRDQFGLKDAVVVVDESPVGRQIFRARRSLVTEHWDPGNVEHAKIGLYAVPSSVPTDVADFFTNMCALALRLDLLRHDATHDPLTGLLNRRSFESLLEQAASRSERYGWSFALLLLDLNDFKQVNDSLGHDYGDRVLEAIGAELRQELRAGDVAARLGGDEFAVILSEGNPAAVPSLLQRLLEAPFRAGLDVGVGFSYGVALSPTDASDAHKLYLVADARLYEAKAEKPPVEESVPI